MIKYVLRRLLVFVPTLLVISVLTFALSKMAPGDPVELRMAGGMQGASGGQLSEKVAGERAYIEMREKLGLHIPAFYFSITSKAYPDSLYVIHRKPERDNLNRLIAQYGNWPQIQAYYRGLKDLEIALFDLERDSATYADLRTVRENINELFVTYAEDDMADLLGEVETLATKDYPVRLDSTTVVQEQKLALIAGDVREVRASFDAMLAEATPGKTKIPTVHWYGVQEPVPHLAVRKRQLAHGLSESRQLHHVEEALATAALSLRPLVLRDGRPAGQVRLPARRLRRVVPRRPTGLLHHLRCALGHPPAQHHRPAHRLPRLHPPRGVNMAVKKGSRYDRTMTVVTFILYSLPSFWIATIFVVFLTTPEYGLNLFPTYGLNSPNLGDDPGFFKWIIDRGYHLILPIGAMVYGSFAFISRQMRGGMVNVLQQDYIRTARAKGLDEKTVTWKHAFRNSLIPIITMFAGFFPFMISGSVVIEVIFSIPGMGRISYESVLARNYPVLFTVLMFSAILTMVGILVATCSTPRSTRASPSQIAIDEHGRTPERAATRAGNGP